MTTQQPDVLTLARQGNPSAIATVLNQALGTENVWVDVTRQDTRLQIVLNSSQVPDQQFYLSSTRAALLCLGLRGIQSVQVYGQQMGATSPAWQQELHLPVVPAPQKSKLAQRQPRRARQLQRLAMPLAVAASFVLGSGFSGFISTQLRDLSRPTPSEAQSAPDFTAIAPEPETLEPAPPPSLKLDPSLPHEDVPYIGGSAPPSPAASPSPKASAIPAASPSPQASPSSSPSPAVSPEVKASPTPTPTASPQASPKPAASPTIRSAPATTENSIVIKAVGDIIPGTNFPDYRLPRDTGYFFSSVRPYLGEADLVFGNFESTLTDYPHSAKDVSQGMTFAFRTPPAYANLLKQAGFDILSVANNHSFDFYEKGFDDTIAHIEQAGMQAVGRKGQIVYTDVKGVKTAFIGFSYLEAHNSMHDLDGAIALVHEAKKNAPIVVVSVHAGAEGTDAIYTRDQTEYFFSENRGNMVQFAHNMVEQGADLVLGHGPHVPRAMELYQGKLIAYSLGNFLGYRTLSTVGSLGTSMILQVQMDKTGNFETGRIIPVALDANGVPYLDDYFQSVSLVRALTQSDFPTTPLKIDDMGYLLRTDG